MSHLLQRHSAPARSELDWIKRVLRCLKESAAPTRFAVGSGVSIANTAFMRRFGGLDAFRESGPGDQEQFYTRLGELELNLRNPELGMALGVGLYRIWLTEALAGRRDAAELLGQELAELSRKAAGGRPPKNPV